MANKANSIGSLEFDPGYQRQVVSQRDQPNQIPPTSEYYAHIVIAVTELDQPRPEPFSRDGFYYVAASSLVACGKG